MQAFAVKTLGFSSAILVVVLHLLVEWNRGWCCREFEAFDAKGVDGVKELTVCCKVKIPDTVFNCACTIRSICSSLVSLVFSIKEGIKKREK